MNIGELAGVVRLAADLGVPKVWAQPMEMKSATIESRIKKVHIDTLPADEVRRAIDQARQEAKRLGVLFVHARALYSQDQQPQTPDKPPEFGQVRARQEITDDLAVRMCQYPWREPFQIVNEDGKYRIWACCYMLRSSAAELAKRCGLEYDRILPADEIYNSAPYWNFRRDLASGKLADICGNCAAAKNYPWTSTAPPALRQRMRHLAQRIQNLQSELREAEDEKQVLQNAAADPVQGVQ